MTVLKPGKYGKWYTGHYTDLSRFLKAVDTMVHVVLLVTYDEVLPSNIYHNYTKYSNILNSYHTYTIIGTSVKMIAFGNKEHTTD